MSWRGNDDLKCMSDDNEGCGRYEHVDEYFTKTKKLCKDKNTSLMLSICMVEIVGCQRGLEVLMGFT